MRKWDGEEADGEYCDKSEIVISENGKMFMLNSDFFKCGNIDNENSFRL